VKFSFDSEERFLEFFPLSPSTAKALTAETASKKITEALLAILSMVDWLIDIPYKIKNKNNHKSNRLSQVLIFI
jgi:hypothetical protein